MPRVILETSISDQWTRAERLALLAELETKVVSGYINQTLTAEDIYDATERKSFLLNRGPSFLETNRKGILNGQ